MAQPTLVEHEAGQVDVLIPAYFLDLLPAADEQMVLTVRPWPLDIRPSSSI